MREPNEVIQITNVDQTTSNITPEPETNHVEESTDQKREEKISMPVNKNDISIPDKTVTIDMVNPLFYEIGPIPRSPRTVKVYFMGLQQVPTDNPYVYEPSRNGFIRIVFAIVFIMLLATCNICFMCNFITPIKSMFEDSVIRMIILIVCSIITISMSYAFSCSACTRSCPCNVICLTLTVIGFSGVCAWLTIKYDTKIIIFAVGTTTVIVLLCLLLACTSFDFTKFILIVIVALLALAVVSLITFLFIYITGQRLKPLHIVLIVVGTVLHSVLLIIELQMVLGGKTVELSPDDYSLGAFMIYTSIITIFIKMMQLMGLIDED